MIKSKEKGKVKMAKMIEKIQSTMLQHVVAHPVATTSSASSYVST